MVEPINTLFNLIITSFGYKYLKLMIYFIEKMLKVKNKMVAISLHLLYTSYFAVEFVQCENVYEIRVVFELI